MGWLESGEVPSEMPTSRPSSAPSSAPSEQPSPQLMADPTAVPSTLPTGSPITLNYEVRMYFGEEVGWLGLDEAVKRCETFDLKVTTQNVHDAFKERYDNSDYKEGGDRTWQGEDGHESRLPGRGWRLVEHLHGCFYVRW